jgi:hypothetical protein
MRKLNTILCPLALLAGCSFADSLNPYADPVTQELGSRNTDAIAGGGGSKKKDEIARHALEVMGSYRRAETPQPYYPVVNPADIRMMWVPDHINRLGDLVPAHYYYLRVLPEGFAVQDAFEIERRLNPPTGGNVSSNAGGGATLFQGDYGTAAGGTVPYQYKEERR